MNVKRLISRAANSCGERNKCVERPGVLQGDCVGMLGDDRRPIEMQMVVAVDVISAPVTCTCRRMCLFQIRSRPFPWVSRHANKWRQRYKNPAIKPQPTLVSLLSASSLEINYNFNYVKTRTCIAIFYSNL